MPKPPTASAPTEVVADPANDRRHRRRFSREEKHRILAEAARCNGRGEVAALLRRESLYSSHLTMWRQQLRTHGEAGLDARQVGRKPVRDERDRKVEQLERDKAKLQRELALAHKVIELAGKAHEILGVALPSLEDDEKR